MKKNKFLLFTLALALCGMSMAGCKTTDPTIPDAPPAENNGGGGTTENEPKPPVENGGNENEEKPPVYSAETLLNTLRGELALSAKWSYSADAAETQEAEVKTYIAADEYYLNCMADGTVTADYHYFRNSEGKVVTKTVDSHNAVKETAVTYQDEVDQYDMRYKNPFAFVEVSMMAKTDYTVTIDASASVGATTVGALIYSMILGAVKDVSEITVTLNDSFEPVSLKIVAEDAAEEGSGNVYTYNGAFASKTSLNVPVYPYPASGEKTLLSQAFEKIRANNYTFALYSSSVDEGKTPHSNGIATEQGVIVTDNVQQKIFGYIDDPDNGNLTEVEASAGKLISTGNSWQGKTLVDDKLPSADFSVDLFEQSENGGYRLRSGSYDLATLLPDAMFSITYLSIKTGSLVITPSADLSTVTYTYDTVKNIFGAPQTITVVLSDFGTTVFPYNLETDYVTKATKWSEISTEGNGVAGFATLFPEGDIDRDIPFYETENGTFNWFGLTWGDDSSFSIEIQYASEDDASWELSGYQMDIVGFGDTGWKETSFGSGVYVKGIYKLTVTGEEDILGGGYTVTIKIERNAAD